jgi:hypothetical protein
LRWRLGAIVATRLRDDATRELLDATRRFGELGITRFLSRLDLEVSTSDLSGDWTPILECIADRRGGTIRDLRINARSRGESPVRNIDFSGLSQKLQLLEVLVVNLSDGDLGALAPSLLSVTDFGIPTGTLRPQHIEALASSPVTPNLRILDLSLTYLSARAIEALRGAAHSFRNLKNLKLALPDDQEHEEFRQSFDANLKASIDRGTPEEFSAVRIGGF